MKKNLQKVLVLALGLTTTIASAQDFNVDSRTRVDNTNSEARTAEQRLTVGASWGGSDWGIHASSDMSYDVANGATTTSVYEAYVSTDVMGFGTLTMGRQDLSFGSGALISSNSWGMDRYTNDGMDFSMNMGGFDINAGTLNGWNTDNRYINASGEFGGATFNVLMLSNNEADAHGYDLGYSLMGGDLSLTYSMNSDYDGDEMTAYSATYQVFDNMSATYGNTSYDGAFNMDNTAMNGGWANGVLGYQAAGSEVTSMGIAYDLGGINLGYTMYSITDASDAETEASAITLDYSLTDNASIGLAKMGGADAESTWITISIRP